MPTHEKPEAFAKPHRRASRCGLRLIVSLSAAILACTSGASLADEDHERARQALEAGEVLPLRAVLERVEREYPGQVVDVELERLRDNGAERWVYKIKLLRSGGALVKLKVDARDGKVLGQRARPGRDGGGER